MTRDRDECRAAGECLLSPSCEDWSCCLDALRTWAAGAPAGAAARFETLGLPPGAPGED